MSEREYHAMQRATSAENALAEARERERLPHRKRSGAKPYRLELKSIERRGWMPFKEWTSLKRYATEEDARKALANKDGIGRLWHARIVAPDGTLIYPAGLDVDTREGQ